MSVFDSFVDKPRVTQVWRYCKARNDQRRVTVSRLPPVDLCHILQTPSLVLSLWRHFVTLILYLIFYNVRKKVNTYIVCAMLCCAEGESESDVKWIHSKTVMWFVTAQSTGRSQSKWSGIFGLAAFHRYTPRSKREDLKKEFPSLVVCYESAGGDGTDQVVCQKMGVHIHALICLILFCCLVREVGIDQWSPLM